MAGQNRRNGGTENRIPERVENAAQSMMSNASFGPRRGYIPPEKVRPQPVPPQWTQNSRQPGPQQPYYDARTAVSGNQRGFMMTPPPSAQPPKGHQKRRTGIIAAAVIALLAILGTGGYFALKNYQHTKTIADKVDPYESLFCPGVYVDGIHLGGMTPEQAMNSVQSQIQQRHDAWKVQLTYNGNPVAEIDADMMEFNVDPTHVMNQAWLQGHTGDKEQRYNDMTRLEQEPYAAYTAKPDGNAHVIDTTLAQIKTSIDKPAVDAKLQGIDKTLPYPFVITDEEYGYSLDTEPVKEQLYRMVSVMESGTVELVPARIEPVVRKADLMKNYMLRSYKYTPIDKHSTENRNKNIEHAFEFINGYELEPGRTFSFNNVVGERTEENGFYPAIEYVYGEHVEGFGGGVCQASTTLYQAAVCAGLQIVDRRPHSDAVSYAEYGTDATVYWVRKAKKIDFSFKNNTDGSIWLFAEVKEDPSNNKRLIAVVSIYGQDMGDVRYEIETEEIETIPAPFEPEYVKDTAGTYVTYKDQEKSVSKAKEGHVVNSYLIEYTSGIRTNKKILYTDRYEAKKERIYVGVKDR